MLKLFITLCNLLFIFLLTRKVLTTTFETYKPSLRNDFPQQSFRNIAKLRLNICMKFAEQILLYPKVRTTAQVNIFWAHNRLIAPKVCQGKLLTQSITLDLDGWENLNLVDARILIVAYSNNLCVKFFSGILDWMDRENDPKRTKCNTDNRQVYTV